MQRQISSLNGQQKHERIMETVTDKSKFARMVQVEEDYI